MLQEIDFLRITILEQSEVEHYLAKMREELFESWHEVVDLRAEPNRQSKTHGASLEVGHRAPTPQAISQSIAIASFKWGFECCDVILHSCYPEVELVTSLLFLQMSL